MAASGRARARILERKQSKPKRKREFKMNTHKPDPSQPINTNNLEPAMPNASQGKLNRTNEMYTIMKPIAQAEKVACVCNPETGTTCMLHFNLDGFILAEALKENKETK
jgi:hypothetical protein